MIMRTLSRLALITALAAAPFSLSARTLPQQGEDLIGDVTMTTVRYEDTFADIGKRFSLGYTEMVLANPDVDPWLPGEGTVLTLPTRYLLPSGPREGIVVNLAEFRMFYFVNGQVLTFPVGVGTDNAPSPLTTSVISSRTANPTWYPPESIRQEHLRDGDILPKVVPPGPDNPLGPYAMRLGATSYLIHGSNKKFGIGMRVSHGCIRMYNADVERLFNANPVGMKIRLIDEPVKIGMAQGQVWLEVHVPVDPAPTENFRVKLWKDAERLIDDLERRHGKLHINRALVERIIDQPDGIPHRIGELAGRPVMAVETTPPLVGQHF